MSLWDKLEERFKRYADFPALADTEGKYLSYHELLDTIKKLSQMVHKHTSEGSRVAVMNSHPFYDALCVLAVIRAGRTLVPMSLNYGEECCCQIIRSASPKLLLTNMNSLPEPISNISSEYNIDILSIGPSQKLSEPDTCIERTLDAPAMIMFTSGTTGRPKGAILSHDNILANLNDIAGYFKLSHDDHMLIVRPLYHAAVMTGEFLHALMSGVQIAFYNEMFSPKRLLSFIEKTGCTVMCATPTLFYHLALHKKDMGIGTLRQAVVSGECLQSKVAEKLLTVFPKVNFFNVYGLTEASPRVSYLPPEYFSSKIGSVGFPLKSVCIKIIDKNGHELPSGEIGELAVRGPNVMAGYWNDNEQTLKKIKNGWLYTGDDAYVDEEGFLYIVGRKDYMIIRAGMNIYPQEIENALLEDAKIKEVIAWGESEPRFGQRICAAIVPSDNSELNQSQAMSICCQRLQPHHRPDEIFIVDKLCRNASGKLIRGNSSYLKDTKQ